MFMESRLMVLCSKPSEIAKRTAIFTAVGQVGSMFAGIMMTAMHKTMENKGGLKGWQWVFLIGTCMNCTVIVCVADIYHDRASGLTMIAVHLSRPPRVNKSHLYQSAGKVARHFSPTTEDDGYAQYRD
jgi:hypothetical protein